MPQIKHFEFVKCGTDSDVIKGYDKQEVNKGIQKKNTSMMLWDNLSHNTCLYLELSY